MGNLLGSPFRKYVNETVISRQQASGKKENRSLELISALNSRNAWIKLASAVYIEENRLNILKKNIGNNDLLENINIGYDLALNNVLQGGLVSKGTLNPNGVTKINESFNEPNSEGYQDGVNTYTNYTNDAHRSGILGYNPNPAYGVGGLDFGYSPMPGIVNMDISDLNRGSIKKSKINIKCHNRAQFDIIDVLYLRLGYTVCLEWGWNHYLDVSPEGEELVKIGPTLIDKEFWEILNEDYSDFLDRIEEKRRKLKGNYDGIVGVISNFSWDFQPDGTYDIRLEVTSLGDVIESLKVNLPPLIDVKTDPYAESRLEDIKKNLEDNFATESEFYDVLYPGLKGELSKIYDSLYTQAFQGNGVFNYNRPSNTPHGNRKYFINQKNPNIAPAIDFRNIADVGGGKSLIEKVLNPPFEWGNIFDDYDDSDPQVIQAGVVSGGVSNIESPEGTMNNNSWKVYANDSINEEGGFFALSDMSDKSTTTKILYKERGVWKVDNFLTNGGFLRKNTPEEEYKFSISKLNSFDSFLLIGWVAGTESGPALDNDNQQGIGGLPSLDNKLGFINYDQRYFGSYGEISFGDLLNNSIDADQALLTYYGKKQFYTIFYSWARTKGNLAGGANDKRFKDADNKDPYDGLSESDKKLAQQILDFKSSIERNKIKNKINNYFFKVRELHADSTYNLIIDDPLLTWVYETDGFSIPDFYSRGLVLADNTVLGTWTEVLEEPYSSGFTYTGNTQGGATLTLEGTKYNASIDPTVKPPLPGEPYIDPIGVKLNGVNRKQWNETVGFPIYSDDPIRNKYGHNQKDWDFFKLDIQPIQSSYFIRLKILLDFINDKVIPKKKGKNKNTPIITIDTNVNTNICYAIDNMISINPKKAIIKNENFFAGKETETILQEKIYKQLNTFIITSNEFIYGKLMNVYLNMERVEEIFSSVDKNNQVSLFTVLKSLCDDINESLGNANNLEPVIDKDLNKIKLIDQTSIPNLNKIRKTLGDVALRDYELKAKQTPLEVFGYNNTNDQSNFVRNVGITTEISKNYATAITIGATANGEVPGMESTAFSRWNVGLKDRFKSYLVDGESKEENGDDLEEGNKEVLNNYNTFLQSSYTKLGFSKSNQDLTINPDFISTNRSIVKNYYSYAQAKTTEENYDPTTNDGIIESSIGFLPINLKLEMDGLGGIRIYDFVKVNSSFLPSNYPETLEFICTGVNHKLEGNDWTTNLKTIATYIDKSTQATSASS